MVFVHRMSAEIELAFVYNFFAVTKLDNTFKNPVLSKNVENFFLLISCPN